MASEGASGEHPPPVQTLATAVLGSVDTKYEFNMDNLSKPELLTLLSIMEGELEARDLVIEALRAQRKEVFLQERYGHYNLTDPFLALQRDFESGVPGGDKERRAMGSSPISVLEAVMAHCRKMQERMSAQLAAAESRQKRLEMEKLQLQSLEQEHRKLTAQLKDEREKNKHIVMMLVRECKQLATRVVEESQRFDELQARLEEEGRASGRLQEELTTERQRSQQMEAKMEKQLSEFDTEREQLRARLGREEAESLGLRQQVEQLRTEQGDGKDGAAAAATVALPEPKTLTSVSVTTEPVSSRTASCQTDLPPAEAELPKKNPLAIPVKPTPANYVGLSLPKTPGRGIAHSSSGGLAQAENGSEGQVPHGLPSGVSPRVQAARYKFQEQDQNGTASQSPPARDLSPTNRDNFAAKQQARHTVTQVLSRFTSPPAGGGGSLRPGLPHSASEGGPFPGRLSHPIGLKSPTVARIDRGNPPPIPPKKPGLSQTPSPPHPPIKVVGDSSRTPAAGLKPATPQLPPKPALDLVPALTASQVGSCSSCPSPGPGRGPRPQPAAAACAECPPVVSTVTTVSSTSSINPPSTSSSISAPSSRSSRSSAGSPLATASGKRAPPPSGPLRSLYLFHYISVTAGMKHRVTGWFHGNVPLPPPDLYQALVCLQSSGGGTDASPCPEESSGTAGNQLVLGRVSVDRTMRWAQLTSALNQIFTSYLQTVCGEAPSVGGERTRSPLGLGPGSISSLLIGDTEWLPGQELPLSPWDLVRKPLSQCITIRIKGLSESCLDELALECLFPLPLLYNYVRLVQQYGNLIFHGLEGSCQEDIANAVAGCIKSKQEAEGLDCDVLRVEVDQHLTKEQLLETFIDCGFLVPTVASAGRTARCVVVLLEGLEKASSLTCLLGDLCHSLDTRDPSSPLLLNTGPHHFCEGSFLIATLSKSRLQGSELRLQQHFRWVTLRWDQEPLHGLLGRQLRRKLLHKVGSGVWTPEGLMERSVLWVSQVWQQLNACLSRLGTHEALLGPQLFLSCPVVSNNTQAIVRWLARLWNAVVVPRVEEAIIARVTTKRSSSSISPSSSSQRPSLSNCGLSAGQQAVVKAALSILVNKAVLLGCPLRRHEMDRYLLEFRGGNFPLSGISSYKGSGGGGGRRGRDSGKLRRSNTSPRKKGGSTLKWSCSGSFREGSKSSTDVRFSANGKDHREPVGLSVFSDDETDLIRELQTMCSSKSEPDISKILQAKDDLILFASTPAGTPPDHAAEQETAHDQQLQTPGVGQSRSSSSSHAAVQNRDRRSSPRARSQLPIPSSRGQQTRAASTANGSPVRNQTPPTRGRISSRTKPMPPSSSNNNLYRNNINNQTQEDIWIFNRDLHDNNK
eukprot:XP_011605923.1 PREDICTED: cortactin-binding protein 2 [Takifugu rubripes]